MKITDHRFYFRRSFCNTEAQSSRRRWCAKYKTKCRRRKLFVRVDRSQLMSHGTPSMGRVLYKIHKWHSTADVDACWLLYGILSAVDGAFETWRKIVASNPKPKWKLYSQTLS